MPTTKAPAALGFRVHTGWAALVAATGPASAPAVLYRARVEMIPGSTPDEPPYVYQAAAKLPLSGAKHLVQESEAEARNKAEEAIAVAVKGLKERGYRIVASGVIAGNRPLTSPLETILGSHSLIHSAEGELFRQAIIAGSEACRVPVTCVSAQELYPRGAKVLRVPEDRLRERLAEAGRDAGKPWAQDQKEALLVALLALEAHSA